MFPRLAIRYTDNESVGRICPGRYFALEALFIDLASVLHVFDITPPLNEKGEQVKVRYEESDGFLS